MRAKLIDSEYIRFSHQAGFEVSSTTRYTGTMEACILATRDWTAGETVQCCSGAIVDLTKEDDAKLKSEGRDFSVMVSTRKKCTCLFLGPARFMNVSSVFYQSFSSAVTDPPLNQHDCDANCEVSWCCYIHWSAALTPRTIVYVASAEHNIIQGAKGHLSRRGNDSLLWGSLLWHRQLWVQMFVLWKVINGGTMGDVCIDNKALSL